MLIRDAMNNLYESPSFDENYMQNSEKEQITTLFILDRNYIATAGVLYQFHSSYVF